MPRVVWALTDARPKVQASHPLPHRGGPAPKYPWRRMAIGSSFFVREWGSVKQLWNSLTSCRANAEKRTGFKFVLQRGPGGIFVWRVK